jgi:16S rRNA (guanine527-N7)-methyltransferase
VSLPNLNVTAEQVQKSFCEGGISALPARAYDQFVAYLALLLRWNARLNLTAIRDPEQMIRRHLVECAFAAQHLPMDIKSLLDYGSGAGLPGIPIAICRPEIRVTLAESDGKKASFLREAGRAAGTGAEVYQGRVESMPQGRFFEAVCMRAVEKMELAVPVASRVAERYLVLLITQRTAPHYQRLTPRFQWMDPISLPNAEQTILAIGKRF